MSLFNDMIPVITTGLLAYGFWVLYRRKKVKSLPEYQNPEIQGVNRRRSHITLSSFTNILTASIFPYSPGVSESTISLNGEWSFQLFEDVDQAIDDRKTNSSTPLPSTIMVPGCWQSQGFDDVPLYTNIHLPFPCTPPPSSIVTDRNPTL